MPVPLVQQVSSVVEDAQAALANIGNTLAQLNGAPRDVNQAPATGSGTDLFAGVKGVLGDVHNAAQLKELLPVVIAVVGILVGRAVLGILLAVLVYYYGQPAAKPAAS